MRPQEWGLSRKEKFFFCIAGILLGGLANGFASFVLAVLAGCLVTFSIMAPDSETPMFRVNWRKFITRFAFMYGITLAVMFLGGCSAAFLGVISGLLPALAAAVEAAVSFVASLEGKTVSPTLSAAVQKWAANVAGLITNLQNIISAAQGAATTSVIAAIQAAMQAISSAMSSILSEFNVTDSATVSKFTSLVGLGIALVETILGLIPVAQAKLAAIEKAGASKEQLAAEDKEVSTHLKNAHKAMQEAFVVIRTSPTANPDVNAALLELPVALP
jgi:hypothetical protein